MAIAHHFARPFCQFPQEDSVCRGQRPLVSTSLFNLLDFEIALIPAARVLNIYMPL